MERNHSKTTFKINLTIFIAQFVPYYGIMALLQKLAQPEIPVLSEDHLRDFLQSEAFSSILLFALKAGTLNRQGKHSVVSSFGNTWQCVPACRPDRMQASRSFSCQEKHLVHPQNFPFLTSFDPQGSPLLHPPLAVSGLGLPPSQTLTRPSWTPQDFPAKSSVVARNRSTVLL